MDRCDLHDMVSCAECNGVAQQYEHSLKEPYDWEKRQQVLGGLPGYHLARFPGHCDRCGLGFGPGSPIRRSDDDSGWVAAACCG